ncbi:uncharacterized protein LOC134229899 [Saccostrea cucullata]|uniref:uncharacterized protein LOC134229899 n=1 Tax=Saccostrea cuccullata TaxID=36930 RepID=UPI002ED27238
MDYNISIMFIILLSTFKVGASSDWNIRNLLQQYFTLCGRSHFCFMHDFLFPWTTQADNIQHNCPPCSCQKKCWSDCNCCPDLYFSYPEPICTSAAILNESLYYDGSSTFLVVDSCPKTTVEETKRKCEGDSSSTEKILFPPVTSQNTPLAYLNRYCADCNNDFQYDPWPLSIVCDEFLDINFFSSYEELIEKGKMNRCNILSYPPQEEINYKCTQDMQVQVHFDSCNKTGSWKTFDYDIKRGCESRYINKDKMYKNMFCKICNPPIYTENVIGRCNVTGKWDEYDPTHEGACLSNDTNPGSIPYKNVFCFSCNKPVRFKSNFLDVDAEIKTKIGDITNTEVSTTFHYEINIFNFDEDFFQTKINGEQADFKERSNETTKDAVTQSPNITNLVFKRISLEGNMNTCGNYGIPNLFSSFESDCSCDPKCIFTDGLYGSQRCCADVPLRNPSVCLSEKKLSRKEAQRNAEELLVTSGCYGRKEIPEFIVRGCHQQFEDVFSMHPVTDQSDIPYLNMYCLQCNQFPSTKLVWHKPWDITADCSFYIDMSNFLLFLDFLNALQAAGCESYYHPPRSVTSCQNSKGKTCFRKSDNIIDKCNKTGNWPHKDPDILWACELMPPGSLPLWHENDNGQLTAYKNVYCALCNPLEWSDAFVDNCSSGVSEISLKKCNFSPKIYFTYPYKNTFCEICTNESLKIKTDSSKICYGSEHPEVSERKDFLLRYYFSPFRPVMKSLNYLYKYPNDNYSPEEASERQCREAQNSLMGGCRNVTCYPGKTLNLGQSCLPLFREARNLRYRMDAYFNCSTQFNTSIGDILTHIHRFTFSKLQSLFGQNSVRELITDINLPCNRETLLENYFQLHLSFKLFFENPVQRLQTELDLLYIKHNFSIPGFIMISNVPSPESNWSCSFSYVNTSYDWAKYREVRVSKLLVCAQIEFSPQEFEIYKTGENNNILLKMYNITLEDDDFDILPEGPARVCVSTLRQIYDDTRTTYKSTLKEISQDSTIEFAFQTLSCIFLLITFCTYCIFQELRTLPGGTIMILIAVLFATDVFILIRKGNEVNTKGCFVYGIITHYLWLSSFFSMNICSFHLYRVFHSKFALHNQANKWCILGKYSVYIFVTPMVVVSSNIAVSVAKHNDIGYGKVKCFIDESLHLIVSFLLPVGLLCTVNLIFFIKTLSTIIRSPKVRKNKATTNEFSIFARLLTITGATWLLQILDGFLEDSGFSDVVGAINSLQGVFIFIAFMCSKRTLQLYRKLILRRRKKEGSATHVTRSTEETRIK